MAELCPGSASPLFLDRAYRYLDFCLQWFLLRLHRCHLRHRSGVCRFSACWSPWIVGTFAQARFPGQKVSFAFWPLILQEVVPVFLVFPSASISWSPSCLSAFLLIFSIILLFQPPSLFLATWIFIFFIFPFSPDLAHFLFPRFFDQVVKYSQHEECSFWLVQKILKFDPATLWLKLVKAEQLIWGLQWLWKQELFLWNHS